MPDSPRLLRPDAATSPARGQDELNLIDFPIGVLQYQQPGGPAGKRPEELVCVIESYDADLERVVPRKLTRRTASKHGFPTPLEDEVLVGLLSLTRAKNGFHAPRVEFTNRELFELMGWPGNGTSNDRLRIALDRLTGLSLKYENSWTTEDGAFQKEFTTGLIESYRFVRQTRGARPDTAERCWVQWASEVFADIRRGNVKELNAAEFFSLQLPLARRMYRFLDKSLAKSPAFEMDLAIFAAHLGLAETKHIGKIKERLAPALEELESLRGFLVATPASERYRKRGPGAWTIRVQRPSTNRAVPAFPRSSPPLLTVQDNARRTTSGSAADLVRAFYRLWASLEDHRASPKEMRQAQMLIDRYGADRVQELLPLVIEAMRRQFPDAKAFGASFLYWPEAAHGRLQRQRSAERLAAADHSHAEDERRQAEKTERRERLLAVWTALSPAEQDDVRRAAAATASATVRQFIAQGKHEDPLVLLACFRELEARRLGSQRSELLLN